MLLDAAGVGLREILVDFAQACRGVGGDISQLRQTFGTKRYKVLHLYLYAVADECEFRKIEVKA